MSNSDDHFGEFGPHSRFKHLVLQTYFDSWSRKLLLRPAAGSKVLYVDACAGRGMDEHGNHGSPVLIAKAAAMSAAQISDMRNQHVDVQVIAVEQNEENFKALRNNLAPFKDRARALHGTLLKFLDDIDQEFAGVPTLFFIDPFGVKSLDGQLVRRALAGKRREVLVYFADQAALRHFGAATSGVTKPERRLATLTSQTTLFPQWQEAELQLLHPKIVRAKKAQEISRESAVRILDCAFDGHDWYETINCVAAPERRRAFIDLYSNFLLGRCGAERVLPFPVYDADGARRYHLLHASGSPKGFTTMKESIEYALNHGPLGPDVAAMVREEMRCPIGVVAERIRRGFAGQRVRWAADKIDRRSSSVKAFALEQSRIMPSQLEELKAELAQLRVPRTGNTIIYCFPPIAPDPTSR